MYPIDEYPHVLIDINNVAELKGYMMDQNLIIGATTTLNDMTNIFQTISEQENFSYLLKLTEHMNLVASIPVKNVRFCEILRCV